MKTRRHRKYGGATNYLPVPEKYEDFNWDMYYLSGHGIIMDNMLFVPANTYVLHLATAGDSCAIFKKDIEDLMYNTVKTNKRRNYWESLKNKTFLKNSINTISTEHMYTPGNLSYNQQNLTNKTISFYEPGDIISNIHIVLKNTIWPMFVIGLYNLPIKHTLRQQLFNVNKPKLKSGENICSLTTSSINKNANPLNCPDDNLFNIPDNLLQHEMFNEHKLTIDLTHIFNIISLKNNISIPKLLIVSTCRNLPLPEQNNVIKKVLLRRLSISTRTRIVHDNILRERLNYSYFIKLYNDILPQYKINPNREIFNILQILTYILTVQRFVYSDIINLLKNIKKYIKIQPELLSLLDI